MRSAKETENFPYSSKIICYIEVDNGGKVTQVSNNFAGISAAYHNAVNKKSRIYAVCPGNYRSDLFEIDDLDALADAFGVPRPDEHVHKLTWTLSPFNDGKSLYADVYVTFECGCSLDSNNIKKFANDMKAQKEWDVATPTDRKTIPIIIDHSEEPSTISVESGIINKMTEPIKILRIYAYENVVEEADKYVRKRMRDMRNPVWLKKKLR